uniref:Variant surface glycoprotein 570 n=1 Tax=Trypanosoma brucei TaxID=5691 RepID=M4SXD2_9TRYP|nr:variant surface glycoprotein 570 [Trypanosoma brucei]
MRVNIQLQTIFVAVLQVASTSGAASTATAAVDSPCTEYYYGQKLIDHFKSQQNKPNEAARQIQEQVIALQLAAGAAEGPQERYGFEILLAIATRKLNRQIKEGAKGNIERQTAIDVLLQRQQQVATAMAMTPTGKLAKSGASHATGGSELGAGNTGKCTVTFKPPTRAFSECKQTVENKPALEKAAAELSTAKQINFIKDDYFTMQPISVVALAFGTVNTVSGKTAQNDCAADPSQSRGGIGHGIGADITLSRPAAEAAAAVPVGQTAEDNSKCRTTAVKKPDGVLTADYLADIICRAQAMGPVTTKPLTASTLSALASDPDAQEIAKAIASVTNTKKSDSDSTAEFAKKVFTQVLGRDEAVTKTVYLDKLNTQSITYNVGETPISNKIEAIAKTPAAGEALAFFFTQAYERIKAKPTTTVVVTTDCKGTNKDQCNKEKCDFKEGECKAKEGVSIETAEKVGTQNTTGSNSFVINKAPLLLAVLIL